MKNKIIKIGSIAALVFVINTANLNAQNTYFTQELNRQINVADDNFQNKNYSNAFNEYSVILKNYIGIAPDKYMNENQKDKLANIYFNRALCAYYLMNNDVDVLFNEYKTLFPNSNRNTKATFYIANWYIQKSDYPNALKTYKSISPEDLVYDEQLEYYYKIGYCYFLNHEYAKAKVNFEKVKDEDYKYSSPSKYYYAHILYEEGQYKLALKEFQALKKDKYFKNVVPYYICQIYYFQDDYDSIISLAPTLSKNAINSKRATELNRMLADAYYKKGEYEQAIPYIQRSIESNQAVNKEDNYLMGYCLMQTGKMQQAVKYFKEASKDDDQMSQNALYFLGYCYLQAKDTTSAKNAYKGASDMSYDKQIQEDAMFSYSKLCINEPAPYNDAIKNFNSYIKKFPKSPKKAEAQGYLVQLYERTRNYKDALELMDVMQKRDSKMNKIYQKIAINRGIELYNNGDYQGAVKTFNKSLAYPIDNSLTASAYYFQAESYYKLKNYNKSIACLNKFYSVPDYNKSLYNENADYSMAYNLFKQKKYSLAKTFFTKVIENRKGKISSAIINDSKLRLADCEYMARNYSKAIDYYDIVIKEARNNSDYAYYQKAMAQGANSNQKAKCETLQKAIKAYPNSTYQANMTYELANTYLALDNNDKALSTYQNFVNQYPSSPNVKESLGKIGMLQYQQGQYDDALITLDRLVKQYPNTSESKAALTTIKNIYMEQNKTDDYFAYIKTIPNAGVSNNEKEKILYQTAENQYMDEKYIEAIKAFEKYLNAFPNTANTEKATYYLADSYLKTGDTNNAVMYLEQLATYPTSVYTEKTLLKLASYYKDKDDAKTIKYNSSLEQITTSSSIKTKSKTAIMTASFNQKDYNQAINYANELMELNTNEDTKEQAEYILAKSYIAMGDTIKAKKHFAVLQSSANGLISGEATYMTALIQYSADSLDAAEKTIKKFSKNPTDEYYLAKSFILWADIFAKKGNDFQAKQTLKSIIDNYDNQEVVSQAQEAYDALENKTREEKEANIKKQAEQDNSVDEVIIP